MNRFVLTAPPDEQICIDGPTRCWGRLWDDVGRSFCGRQRRKTRFWTVLNFVFEEERTISRLILGEVETSKRLRWEAFWGLARGFRGNAGNGVTARS